MTVCHEIKVEVMRYLDAVAARLQSLAPEEREFILQQLYARISHALERCQNRANPTLHDLRRILADLPSPRTFGKTEAKSAVSPPNPIPHSGARTAMIGAVLMPFALVLFITALTLASGTPAKLTSWEWVVMLVGFQAPIFVTMLGIISIVNMRESADGPQGMAVAVCITLIFPLLLLDGMLFYLARAALHTLWHASWLVPLLVVLVTLMLDIRIIRGVWQAASRPADALGG